MRFYQPLTLGIERRRVTAFAEDRQGPQRRPPAAWGEGVPSPTIEYEEHPAAEVLKALQQAPPGHLFWLIRGEPGAGKSTLLAHWFSTWARAIPAVRLGMTVPVFVRLRELEPDDLKQEPAVLADRLWRRGARLAQAQLGQDAPAPYRLEWGRHFQPIWLLDGLDEVRSEWLNENLYEALAVLPGLKLVSCRTAVYAALREHADAYKEALRDYVILGLKPPEQRSFLEQALEDDIKAAGSLHDRLQANAQLRLLAGNPLMLTLIAELADRLELPATRAAFYREAIARLWGRKPLPGQDIRYLSDVRDRLLIALAEKMGLMRLEENLAGLIESSRSVAGDDYQILLDALERTNLLVIDRHRETARFFHLTFQEYYLAQALQPQGLQAALQRHWDDARYEETLALLIAILFERGQVEEINRGIQWFITWGQQTHRKHPQALWKRRRSPLRTVLHLLSRSGMALNQLPEVENTLWKAVEKSLLLRYALSVDSQAPPDLLARLAADQNVWVRQGIAWNPSLPPEALGRLATDPDQEVRRAVAGNPSTSPTVFAGLAADSNRRVRWGVAVNLNTPPDLLARLAADLDQEVCGGSAKNPNTPPQVLARLATNPEYGVRAEVARNPSTSSEALAHLAADSNERVRRAVAENPSTPPDVLARLAVDPEQWVRRGFAWNLNLPPDLLTHLTADPDQRVRQEIAGNLNIPPNRLAQLAADPEQGMRWMVARNRSTPPEVLAHLATDSDQGVCAEVAENPSTPPQALVHLITNADQWVRRGVAGNPNTPPNLLTRLAADPEQRVRWEAARNLSTPPEILAHLAADPEQEVRWEASWNRSTPPEILARLADDSEESVRLGAASNPRVILEDLGRQDHVWSCWINRFYGLLRT